MTVGMIAPTTNAPSSETYEANWRAEQDRAYQHAAWEGEGARLLGYVEVSENVWQQRMHEQTGTLPPRAVHQARQALQATVATYAAYASIDQQAAHEAARMGLSAVGAEDHRRKMRSPAYEAWQASQKPARIACRDLGQLAEEAEQLRNIINSAGGRRQRIEAQYQTALTQLQAEVDAAQLRAAQLGI